MELQTIAITWTSDLQSLKLSSQLSLKDGYKYRHCSTPQVAVRPHYVKSSAYPTRTSPSRLSPGEDFPREKPGDPWFLTSRCLGSNLLPTFSALCLIISTVCCPHAVIEKSPMYDFGSCAVAEMPESDSIGVRFSKRGILYKHHLVKRRVVFPYHCSSRGEPFEDCIEATSECHIRAANAETWISHGTFPNVH